MVSDEPDPAKDAAEAAVAAARPAVAALGPAPETYRYVDLTLGAWRPREAAMQLAAIVGVALAPGLDADPAASPIGTGRRGIDAAAVGDPIAFLAHDDAKRIVAALPAAATIVVLAPRHGRGLGTLNDWLFFYLRRMALALVVVGDEPAAVMARSAFERRAGVEAPPIGGPLAAFTGDQQRLLRFFPGLLPKAIAERFALDPAAAALVPVGPAHYLIPPAYRDSDPALSASALDAMEAAEVLDDGLRALAQTFCTAHFADSAALAGLAAAAFRSGEIDLARELAARARNVARDPTAAASADLLRQEIRLHQRRFAEILATPEPSRRAPADVRGRLAAVRLRAAIERGERDGVLPGLDAVLARLDGGMADADDVHLLSLHVAARIAAGDGDSSRPLATRIGVAAASADDERVVFLAAMNIAALARERRDRAEERQALAAAFATSAGARSLGEIVHMNVAVARAEDDPASPAARSAWLRAALAWLAFEPVEAFPVAAVEVVLGTVSVPKPHIDQAISEALLAAIGGVAGDAAAANRAAGTLPAVRVSGGAAIAPDAAIGGPGVTVLCSRQRAEGQALSQPRETLLGFVWAALRELCPAAEGFGTILVDGNLGLDLPATRDQAVGLALRAGVTEILYGDERLAIDAATRPRLAADLRVGLSPAVAAIVPAAADPGSAASGESGLIGAPGGALLVRFRRHLAATTVSGSDADLLAHIRDRGRMPLGSLAVLQGMPLAETERLLRGLEARRIVRVDVEPR